MKHAYLIIAHNEFALLEKQMRLLDDPRNDFYIHIDKKVKDFPFDTFHSFLKHSRVHYIDRLDIRWGDFNMVLCEMRLLEAAVKGNYRYYHLLSGVDLPLKSNNALHRFFEENDGKELVHFACEQVGPEIYDRVRRFYFRHLCTHRNRLVRKLGSAAEMLFEPMYRLGIRRPWDADKAMGYGAQWFSITHELAEYVLSQKGWVCRTFPHTACADEIFLQTIVRNSPFADKLYWPQKDGDCRANMRLIDWTRGNGRNPWIFRKEDYGTLIHSPLLFARKFSTAEDAQVVEAIYQYVAEKNK